MYGVDIGSQGNTVGGTASGAGNVISGNADDGIYISDSANLVEGNLIGTTADGSAAMANSSNGIYIDDAAANTVGGTAAGRGQSDLRQHSGRHRHDLRGHGQPDRGKSDRHRLSRHRRNRDDVGVKIEFSSGNMVGARPTAGQPDLRQPSRRRHHQRLHRKPLSSPHRHQWRRHRRSAERHRRLPWLARQHGRRHGPGRLGNLISANTSVGIDIEQSTATSNLVVEISLAPMSPALLHWATSLTASKSARGPRATASAARPPATGTSSRKHGQWCRDRRNARGGEHGRSQPDRDGLHRRRRHSQRNRDQH